MRHLLLLVFFVACPTHASLFPSPPLEVAPGHVLPATVATVTLFSKKIWPLHARRPRPPVGTPGVLCVCCEEEDVGMSGGGWRVEQHPLSRPCSSSSAAREGT